MWMHWDGEGERWSWLNSGIRFEFCFHTIGISNALLGTLSSRGWPLIKIFFCVFKWCRLGVCVHCWHSRRQHRLKWALSGYWDGFPMFEILINARSGEHHWSVWDMWSPPAAAVPLPSTIVSIVQEFPMANGSTTMCNAFSSVTIRHSFNSVLRCNVGPASQS